MLAFVQVSKTQTKKNLQFYDLYQKCYDQSCFVQSVAKISKLCIPGHIIGCILLPGHLSSTVYKKKIADEPTKLYMNFYSTAKKDRKIFCYPIINTFLFEQSVPGIKKGNISALKIQQDKLKELKLQLNRNAIRTFRSKLQTFNNSQKVFCKSRVLIMRKEHIINIFMGIKAVELRKQKLNDYIVPKITKNFQMKQLLKQKKHKQNEKALGKLRKFVSNL